MTKLRNSLFGRLILETGLVTREQVEECLELQKQFEEKGKKVPRLGELMAKRGYLTVDQVKHLLKQQRDASEGAGPSGDGSSPETQNSKKSPDSGEESLEAGAVFGKFRIIHKLGSDNKGTTYKAEQVEDGTLVALRVLNRDTMLDASYLDRFSTLAKKASKLKHENIQRILSAGTARKQHYYAAEYMEGVSLRRLLESRGRIEPLVALDFIRGVCRALEYGHARGMIHQELTPANIILRGDKSVVVAGFGAVPEPIRNLKQLVAMTGEIPFYVAPEQADGHEDSIDPRTDLYSLGAILYHILSGQPPFAGGSVEEVLLQIAEEDLIPVSLVVDGIPEPLSRMVAKLLSLDPDDRFLSATEVLEEIDEIVTALQLEGDTVAIVQESPAPNRKSSLSSSVSQSAVHAVAEKSGASALRRVEAPRTSNRTAGAQSRVQKHFKENKKGNAVLYVVAMIVAIGLVVVFFLVAPAHLAKMEQEKSRLIELEEKNVKATEEKMRQEAAQETRRQMEAIEKKKQEKAAAKAAEKQRTVAASPTGMDAADRPVNTPIEGTANPEPATEASPKDGEQVSPMKNRLSGIDLNEDPN